MLRVAFLLLFGLVFSTSKGQVTNSGDRDSLFKIFPNPTHDRFFVTTEGRVFYATIISAKGTKRTEYFQYEIANYENQLGWGCIAAGCTGGAYVQSNFISAYRRKDIENGLYFLVLMDDLGNIYHRLIVFQ